MTVEYIEQYEGEHFKITKEEIRELRKDYEKEKLYMTTIKIGYDQQDFVFKTASRHMIFEFVHAMNADEEPELEEVICETCVLYPEDYDFQNGPAGISKMISTQIVHLSGMLSGQGDQLLAEYRYEMGLLAYQIDCVIHEAFPEYSLEEISTWDMEKAMYYFSRAEWILENIRGFSINISPGEAELERNPELRKMVEAQQQGQGQPQAPQYVQQKDNPGSDFSEYKAQPVSSLDPEELMKKDKSELTEEEIEIIERHLMNMIQEESDKYGYGQVAPVTKDLPKSLPELSFFKQDFELGRE